MDDKKRAKILDRIKKLQALSESSNPHEAANALSRMQKLMAEYDLSSDDIALADIEEQYAETDIKSPAQWHIRLVSLIADIFQCAPVWVSTWEGGQTTFIGLSPRPELATYCWNVLYPKLVKARSDFVKKQPNQCKRTTKAARGNAYAESWVIGIRSKVQLLAIDDKTKALIATHKKRNHQDLSTTNGRSAKGNLGNSRSRGYRDGKAASIHAPVSGQETQKLTQQQ